MLSDEEAAAALEMLALARRLASSDVLMAHRAGERIAAILVDLLYEHDPWAGLPDHSPYAAGESPAAPDPTN